MNWTTVTSRAVAGLVAGVAGFASYEHIVSVARRAGESDEVAVVLPLSIDGLIVVGTLAMIEDRRAGRLPRLSARVAIGFGVVATLAANIASAHPSTSARMVASVAPLAFLVAIEVLSRRGRLVETVSAPQPVDEPVEPTPDPWLYAEPIGPQPVADQVDKLSTPTTPVRKPQPSSRERVERAHRRTPDATHEELARRLNLSTKTVQRWRPAKPAEAHPINGHDVLQEVRR